MALFFFVAAVASGCRRMLADGVTSEEAPRNLKELSMHFQAGDWAPHGVLLLEADGDVCESGTGGDASDDGLSASWDTPEDGCYRVDAHSAGEECGFNAPVQLSIDWCAGRTQTLKYTPGADGWTALGVFPFHPGHNGGIVQEEGAVDAFRVVKMDNCRMGNPVFGSLTVETDAIEMAEDLAAQLVDKIENMGDVLTAFFHPQIKRRLTAGEKAMNHVVIDFDTSKLGTPFKPTDAAVKEATQLVCSLLDTVECGKAASFKLDESGAAKKVAPANVEGVWAVVAGLGLAVLAITAGTAVLAQKCAEANYPEQPKTVFVTPKEESPEDAVEEKKPQVEDDNVSTVTPTSIPDSLPSMEDTRAEQQV
jgi:hypothetical protein